jgi:membrane protein DedA with SNARE-associated domain
MRLIGAWIAGGLFMLMGTWIVNNLRLETGVSEVSYVLALIVALVFFLIAGLCWINVSVAAKHKL